ncbi:pyrroline-5-carboxylate reductase [Streptomyces sp. NPDC014006]|uniref:pyrroline-5-carboxylate reductase n=1 Tax=Streptomyces sp. NPDC014006 TaxID=3364870 RepID=UPI0036FFBB6F
MPLHQRIVVVGAGHMGSVLVQGLRATMPQVPLTVVEAAEERAAALRAEGVQTAPQYRPEPSDLVLLALPPQALDSFADTTAPGTFREVTVVSVMAGVPIAVLSRRLGAPRVVRAMPNMASQVFQGMTVLCAGPGVAPAEAARAEGVLGSIGRVLAVSDEALLDDATALAGGGPAFVAYVAKAFRDFAEAAGFTDEQALDVTCQVLRGTADLLERTGQDPEQVYRSVMTPGGTTEQGILALEEHDLHGILVTALRRAARRARELGDDSQPIG